MSLINQMLQDLEARRSEATDSSAFGGQIRVVPARRGLHPAWWACLALAVACGSLLAWPLFRPELPATPAQVAAAAPHKAIPPALIPSAPAQAPAPAETGPVQPVQSPAPTPEANTIPLAEVVAAVSGEPQKREPAPTQKEQAEKPESVASTKPEPVQPNAKPQASFASQPERLSLRLAHSIPEAAPQAPLSGGKQIKEQTPQQRADNEYRKALQLAQQGRKTEATPLLEQALLLDARHVAARQVLISLQLDAGKQDNALQTARAGLAQDPGQPGLAMIAARLQVEKGELQPAIDTLQRALPNATERADYQAFLAALLQRAEHHKQAVEHYAAALRKSPQNGVWWMGMGISLQADERRAEAADAFRRARVSDSLTAELRAFVETRLAQLQR